MSRLVLENLEYSFGGAFRLGPLDLEFPEEGFTVILGPNGSGKSTLLGLIMGFLKPKNGRIVLNNAGPDSSRRQLGSLSPRERARYLGLVPQLSQRSFDFTVVQLVKMGLYPRLSLFSRESRQDEEKIDEVLRRLDLYGMRGRSVRALSGGEYQKVLLARILVQDPEILLLDEPANHLDLKHQNSSLGLLKEETDRGKTVIAVLHDINQALFYAQWVILLDKGRVFSSGRPETVIRPEVIKQVYGIEMEEYQNQGGRRLLAPAFPPGEGCPFSG